VTPATLHALFERLLGNAGPPTGDAHAVLAGEGELAETPERSIALLAAYLDDGLDAATQQALHARMARSAAALHDVASADAFIDAVTAAMETAPADLVAASLSRSHPARAIRPRRSFRLWTWSGAVAALATAALVGWVSIDHHAPPLPTLLPITATLTPAPAPPPVVAASPSRPVMVPAGAETKVQKDCKTKKAINGKPCRKPAMAPERPDAVPGRSG